MAIKDPNAWTFDRYGYQQYGEPWHGVIPPYDLYPYDCRCKPPRITTTTNSFELDDTSIDALKKELEALVTRVGLLERNLVHRVADLEYKSATGCEGGVDSETTLDDFAQRIEHLERQAKGSQQYSQISKRDIKELRRTLDTLSRRIGEVEVELED